MTKFRGISEDLVLAVHELQISEHGGASGIRDLGVLKSTLSRPHQKAAYGEPNVFDFAASYAYGLARNHAFVDGNKRTALVICETVLELNGYRLVASDVACVLLMQAVAADDLTEEELAEWLRENSDAPDHA